MSGLEPEAESIRQRRGLVTRGAILEAAQHIFAEVGLHGARTEAIAAAAHVNKALLYYYFKSKEKLFEAVIECHLKDFRDRALAELNAPSPARTILLRYISMHFDFISARPQAPRIFLRMMLAGEDLGRLAREYSVPLGQALVGVIERGIREGEFRPVDPWQTVISLGAVINFYFAMAPMIEMVARIDPYDKQQLMRRKQEVLDLVRYGLFRNPEAPSL